MKIIDISNLRMKKANDKVEQYLREFDDHYEYCIIKDYEMMFDEFKSQSIQIDDYFVTLLELKHKTLLASLLFPKTYDIHEIVEWLDTHSVSFNEKDKGGYFISKATTITSAVKFKGDPIVVASRGRQKAYYSIIDLPEITELYDNYSQIVNTGNATPVNVAEKHCANAFS